MIMTPNGNEKSVIDEVVKLRFHDLTDYFQPQIVHILDMIIFQDQVFYSSGNTDNMSTVYCNTPVELTDNRSNFVDCYPILRVGKANGQPSDNKTKALNDVPIRCSIIRLL